MEGVNLWMRVTYKFQKNLPSSNFNDSRVVTVSHNKNFNVNYTLYMIYLFPFANMILNKELEWKLNVEKKIMPPYKHEETVRSVNIKFSIMPKKSTATLVAHATPRDVILLEHVPSMIQKISNVKLLPYMVLN